MTESFANPENLFRDCAAGDAVSGSAGGIGFVIIRFRVDDDRGPAI
jgi:hypothetical protein